MKVSQTLSSRLARMPIIALMAALALGLSGGNALAAGSTSTTNIMEGSATWQRELFYAQLKAEEVHQQSADGTLDQYTRVCLYVETRRSADAQSYQVEAGCGEVANGSLRSTSLSKLALAPVTLSVEIRSCPTEGGAECELLDEREVAISGDWAANGDLKKFREMGKFDDANCTYHLLAEGKQRAATAAISIDGHSWKPSQQGYILQQDVTERANCR